MPVDTTTARDSRAVNGDTWVIGISATDSAGELVAATMALSVFAPSGELTGDDAVAWEATDVVGLYEASVPLTEPGRWLAVGTASGTATGRTAWSCHSHSLTSHGAMPCTGDVVKYLRKDAEPYSSDDLAEALAAEAAAQRAKCRTGPVYSADLREALLRRVAVNLAKRNVTLGLVGTDSEAGASRLPTSDPEIRRLEGPYRKWPVG